MKKHFTHILFLFLFSPSFLLAQNAKKVLIFGIDGCRSDALEVANTPVMDALIANGFFSPDAMNTDVTSSGPGWSAITCGVWAEKHLVSSNNFSGNNYAQYPHFFKYIEDQDEDWQTVSFCHWAPINDEIVQDHADFKLNLSSDALVASTAADYLTTNDPDVMFLHFDDVDHAGHASGFSPDNPEYIAAIEVIDGHLTTVLQALENRATYAEEDWLIISTTDHGGNGTSHGGASFGEQRVFISASGANVPQELILRDSSIVFDQVEDCLNNTSELRFQNGSYVQIAPNEVFDFGSDQDFTVECRVRTNVAADVAIVGNKDWNTGLNKGFVFSFRYASGPEWKVNIGDGTNRADLETGGEIADGEWYTLSASFDRDGYMKMYQDGVFLDSIDISGIGDITTGQSLFFGTDVNGNYQYDGALAEVRVWNTVVPEDDLLNWHCASLAENHPAWSDLLGYWKLDEGEGLLVNDYSGNEYNGHNIGAEWMVPDSMIVYDFSQTPRLVDIVPTALTHLCIPIDEAWDFDGQSLVEECVMVATETPSQATPALILSPIPAGAILHVDIEHLALSRTMTAVVYDAFGKFIQQQKIDSEHFSIDISELAAGEYFLVVQTSKNSVSAKFVKL